MADLTMLSRSPLAGHLPPGRHGRADGPPGVAVTERGDLAAASLALRAGQGAALATALLDGFGLALPQRAGCTAAGALELVWTGPGQWLALDAGRKDVARFGFARALAARLGGAASVTDLTGARAVLRLSGPAVREMLAKLVPIDLDESVFPPGAAALTLAGHMGVTLWRPPTAKDAWHIACYRSFGESLAHDVLEAAAEFGCEVSPTT
ncbi:MAG TPA: sarcosine oxidase subunit gamma family protein [Falsiroseomonas sp.]|nr:sarcosine oxidase subunit gamma family protein [Falsiroseomonas sp.]